VWLEEFLTASYGVEYKISPSCVEGHNDAAVCSKIHRIVIDESNLEKNVIEGERGGVGMLELTLAPEERPIKMVKCQLSKNAL
jgi:hypothetical protein